MKHARADYAHIQDLTGRIPEDEPVFLIRAQDIAGPAAVLCWANVAEKNGAGKGMVEAARAQAKEMWNWQQEHGSKVPDLPTEALFKIGDTVKVVRVLDSITTPDLLGFTGTVREIDPLPNGHYNYDVDGHYLNEEMLEAA
jgi:hypothetical protein